MPFDLHVWPLLPGLHYSHCQTWVYVFPGSQIRFFREQVKKGLAELTGWEMGWEDDGNSLHQLRKALEWWRPALAVWCSVCGFGGLAAVYEAGSWQEATLAGREGGVTPDTGGRLTLGILSSRA